MISIISAATPKITIRLNSTHLDVESLKLACCIASWFDFGCFKFVLLAIVASLADNESILLKFMAFE